jgi:glycine betaine/choline ABC-type transport system substrate-binding protein
VALFLAIVVCGCASGCGGTRGIVVGSKNFTEQLILGEVVAQQIERCAGLPVERRFQLGGTLMAHQAMQAGEIDVYPEYTGTALLTVLKESPRGMTAADVRQRVRTVYRERYGMEWLDPLGFQNTFAMAVPGSLARMQGWRTLSDAASSQFAFRLGVGYEFEQREDGLPGLRKVYPFQLNGAPRSMDLGLLYRAVEQGQVEMVAGNSTDGAIARMGLVVLEDDRGYFPPYEAAVLLRGDVSERHPRVRGCLEQLSGRLDEESMRTANEQVESGQHSAEDVAKRVLAQR